MPAELIENAAAAYFILAIGYNLASLILSDSGYPPLAPTEPVQAILMMTVLYSVYAGEDFFHSNARSALLATYIFLIARFGIYSHVAGYCTSRYASRTAWATAIGINAYGVCALGLALLP